MYKLELKILLIDYFFAFKIEVVVLEPMKYILPLAVLFVVIDAVALFIIFRNTKKIRQEGNHE